MRERFIEGRRAYVSISLTSHARLKFDVGTCAMYIYRVIHGCREESLQGGRVR